VLDPPGQDDMWNREQGHAFVSGEEETDFGRISHQVPESSPPAINWNWRRNFCGRQHTTAFQARILPILVWEWGGKTGKAGELHG